MRDGSRPLVLRSWPVKRRAVPDGVIEYTPSLLSRTVSSPSFVQRNLRLDKVRPTTPDNPSRKELALRCYWSMFLRWTINCVFWQTWQLVP